MAEINNQIQVICIPGVQLNINNTEEKWVAGKTFRNVEFTYDAISNSATVTLPKTRPQSDITQLASGAYTQIYSKRNNKSGKYEIQFSLTGERIKGIGKTVVKRELNTVFDAIWEDIE